MGLLSNVRTGRKLAALSTVGLVSCAIIGTVAQGAQQIAQNIGGVAASATSTSRGAATTQTSAADLARMAGEVDRLAAGFSY